MEASPLVEWLVIYGYIVFFPLVSLEGSIVTVTAGFLASLGYFNPFYLGILYVISDFLSDLALLYVGSTGHGTLLKLKRVRRILKNIEKQKKEDETVIGTFVDKFEYIFALFKLLPIPQAPTAILLAAGFLGVDVRRLIRTFAWVSPIKAVLYIGFGYFIGVNIFKSGFFGSTLSVIFIIVGVLLLVLMFVATRRVLKQDKVPGLKKRTK